MPRDYTNQSPTAYQRLPEYKRGDDWIRDFLHTAKVGHIASSLNVQPFINPGTFWFDEEHYQIVFHSNVAGRVRSNLENNPRVCFEASELGKLLPSNVALDDIDRIRAFVEARLFRVPLCRKRLARVPLEGTPVWIDDESFNLQYHVRHTHLPVPDDERLLKRLCGRLASQRLDPERPLWELWVVEGLEGERCALVAKAHESVARGLWGLGLLETLLTVLDQMEVFEAVVATELNRYLPFLLTTTVMMEAVKKGAGREGAHEAIKEHAVAAIGDLRTGKIVQNDLLQRLAADQRLGLSAAELQLVLAQGRANSGDAGAQVDYLAEQVDALARAKPEAASYAPGTIL